MKKIISLFALVIVLLSCNSNGQNNVTVVPNQSNIQVQAENIPGFNVPAFANLVKTTANPQLLEQQINDPNTGINTLDLDKDGNVDYLKIIERQNQLIVIDETPTSQIQIAALSITPNGDVSVNGSQMYCGPNYYYHNHYSLTDALLLGYLLRPHAYYIPSYRYGVYPSYYRRTSVSYTKTRIVTRNTVSNNRTNYNNYNRNANSAPTRKSLTNPTTSQKSFGIGSNKPLNTSGFGKTVTPSKPASSSWFKSSGSSFGKSSGSGFGKSSGFSRPSGGSFRRK